MVLHIILSKGAGRQPPLDRRNFIYAQCLVYCFGLLDVSVTGISFLVSALRRGGSAENLLPMDSYLRSSISIILAASSIMVPEARAASSENGVVISRDALFHSQESRRRNGTGSGEWVLIAKGV